MEETLNIISEQFRKYLIEVIYEEHHYFTVWGTDLLDKDIDKWLVDQTGRMLLFKNLSSLRDSLGIGSSFVDNDNLTEWINHPAWQTKPDNISNFDLLLTDDLSFLHPSLIDLYDLIGVLEDFAIQRNDKEMMSIFRTDLFMEFKDEAADTFVWEGQDEFDKAFDFTTFSKECRNIHKDLKEKISVLPL